MNIEMNSILIGFCYVFAVQLACYDSIWCIFVVNFCWFQMDLIL